MSLSGQADASAATRGEMPKALQLVIPAHAGIQYSRSLPSSPPGLLDPGLAAVRQTGMTAEGRRAPDGSRPGSRDGVEDAEASQKMEGTLHPPKQKPARLL